MSCEVRDLDSAELRWRGGGTHNKVTIVELVGQVGEFELREPLHRANETIMVNRQTQSASYRCCIRLDREAN